MSYAIPGRAAGWRARSALSRSEHGTPSRGAATVRSACLILAGLVALGLGPGIAVAQDESRLATGAGPGGGPHVRVFDGVTGGEILSLFAYPFSFTGGVRVALCDFNGDGTPDLLTGAGPGGGPHVRVFDGVTGGELPGPIGSFFAYDGAFAGGIYVACGDVNGDGTPDIVTGAGPGGGPHVRVFDGVTGGEVLSLFAFPGFTGGVRVAACDFTGDGRADVVAGAGPGGGPHVRVFDGTSGAQIPGPLGSFFAFDAAFTGGVFVACGDVSGDGTADVVAGAGIGGGPHVRVFDGTTGAPLPGPIGSFFAYLPAFAGGVRVAACDLTADGQADVVTGAGMGGGPHVHAFDAATGNPLPPPLGSFFAFDPGFMGGVHVGCSGPTDANDPPVNTVPGPQTVLEDTPLTFSTAGSNPIAVADPDAGSNPVQVTLSASNGTLTLAGTAGLSFTAGDGTGDATMTFTGTISAINAALDGMTFTPDADFTGAASVSITTDDQGNTGTGGPQSDTDSVDVTVEAETAPTVSSTTPADGASNVALAANVSVTFSEPVDVTGSWFQIACATSGTRTTANTLVSGGPITFTLDPNVDFSPGESCTLTVFAAQVTDQDASDPPDAMAANFTATFTAAAAPVVDPATFAVAENSTNGTAVGMVTFTDPDAGQTHTFAITGGNTGGAFAINASNGLITVANTAALNFETTPSFSLTVEVTDNGAPPLTGSATITVNVLDVNEAPVVNPATVSLTENSANGTAVTTVTFTDPDAGQTHTFAITGGNTGGAFAINPATGAITVATSAAVDFETTPQFLLTVQVTDNGVPVLSGSATITVNLTDANDPPVAQPKSYDAQANMKISIPAGSGLLVGATDQDDAPAVLTVGSVSVTSPAGGDVTFTAATGAFDFDPPAGVTGPVTFTYTVCDDGAPIPPQQCSAPATVTFTVAAPVIWFVDDSASPGGTGRLSAPFQTLAAADAVDAANHKVFLFSGVYATGLALNTDEALVGQGVSGASFDAVFGIAPPAGTIARPAINGARPTVQGTVTLNTNGVVRGLNLSTGSATGLNDPVAAITGVTVNEVSVTTTTGTAVNLSNAGGALTFDSVSSTGAANGISLTNTTGSFTVTGTGTPGSGGTISASTGAGINLSSVQSVSLDRMVVQNGGDDGIRGSSVTGFTLANSTISGNGNAVGEHGLDFTSLLGTASLTDTIVTGSAEHNLAVVNSSGTLTLLTITGTPATCQFTNTSTTIGSDGILFQGNGTATMSISVSSCTFNHNRGDHFQATTDAVSTATMDVVFQNNVLTGDGGVTIPAGCTPGVNCGTDLGGGITISPAGSATLTFDVLDNNIQGATSSGITVNLGADPSNPTPAGLLKGTVSGNTIGNPAVPDSGSSQGDGINVTSNGAGTTTVAVTNNSIHEYSNLSGIQVHQRDGDGTLNVTISGNTISSPGTFASNGLLAQAGSVTGDQGFLCVDIGGAGANSLAGSGANLSTDFRVRQRILTTVRLPGYVGLNNNDAAVILLIQGQNNGVETGSATNNVAGGGGGFVGGAACPLP